MIVYYHTKSYIYAVVNERCARVLETDGRSIVATRLVGHSLSGGIRIPHFNATISVGDIAVGDLLRFVIGTAVVLTQAVQFIELAQALSIPPRPHSIPPYSLPPPASEVLHVPRLSNIPESMRPPKSQK